MTGSVLGALPNGHTSSGYKSASDVPLTVTTNKPRTNSPNGVTKGLQAPSVPSNAGTGWGMAGVGAYSSTIGGTGAAEAPKEEWELSNSKQITNDSASEMPRFVITKVSPPVLHFAFRCCLLRLSAAHPALTSPHRGTVAMTWAKATVARWNAHPTSLSPAPAAQKGRATQPRPNA